MLRIYKASAGSGKTYTLVREYLRLAFQSTDAFKHILAITFTNKAAAEMKSRVIESLEGIAAWKENYNDLTFELSALTGKQEDALRKEAGMILRNMLHQYADISISTIDSFVHRIVRAFTYDLHLPMNFEIEMDSDKLLLEAVDLMLDRLNEADTQVTQAVLEFAEGRIEEGKSWRVERDIASLGKELFVEDAISQVEKLRFVSFDAMREARKSLFARRSLITQRLYAEGKKAYDLILNSGLTTKDFHQGARGLYGFFSAYASEQFPSQIKGNSYVLTTVNEDKWSKTSSVTEDLKAQFKQHYEKIISIWEADGKDFYLCELLLRNFFSFILLADLQKLMEEWKRSNHLLHISDLQHRVFDIVKDQEAPIIYERIGDWYNNLLIDEFQDTSVVQWRNLLPLIENTQFKNQDSLIVGDGKQAIYRFRGGEVEQFSMLPAIYGSHEDKLLKEREVAVNNYGVEVIPLEKNFRSRGKIIDFNNALYRELLQLPELTNKTIYEDYHQLQGRKEEGGFVSIEFLKTDENDEYTIHDYRCERVEEILTEALEKGYSYRDVAVLTRSNSNASIIASYLVSRGIQVVSPESLLIHHSPKVRLLLSALAYLDRMDNHIARMEVLHFTHLLLGQPIQYEQIDMNTSAVEFEKLILRTTGIPFNSSTLPTGRLVDLLHQLVFDFNIDSDDPFVQFFLDEGLLYASRYGNNINDFLMWWEKVKNKKSILYPESMDAVRIMTIHKSKGLQFPVVILPDANGKKYMNKNFFWVNLKKQWVPQLNLAILPVDKKVQETEFAPLYEREDEQSFLDLLNLLYVATTRPEDALYILSEELKKEPDEINSVTALLTAFLKMTGQWEGFRHYTFGEDQYRKIQKAEKKVTVRLYERQKTKSANLLTSAIRIKMKSALLWSENDTGKIDTGNLLHEILKQVRYAGEETKVVCQFAAEGFIQEEETTSWIARIKAVTGHPEMETFFTRDCEVVNERPLLKKDGKMRIPDRVVHKGKSVVVIDYKTGNPRPEHHQQLNDYAAWLSEAGIMVDRKILFYTATQTTEVLL